MQLKKIVDKIKGSFFTGVSTYYYLSKIFDEFFCYEFYEKNFDKYFDELFDEYFDEIFCGFFITVIVSNM